MDPQSLTRLAEKSVVSEIRDWQWRCINSFCPQNPGLSIQLGKRPEYRMGDLIIEDNDRFLLFEVKSTREQIKEEWLDFYGNPKAKKKQALLHIEKILAELGIYNHEHAFDSSTANHISMSLRCHYFIFWGNDSVGDPAVSEQLWTVPYSIGVAREKGLAGDRFLAGLSNLSNYSLGASHSPLDQDEYLPIMFSSIPFFTMDMIHTGMARIIGKDLIKPESPPTYAFRPVGLPIEEFQTYVDQLCGDKGEMIHSIVMSTSGRASAEFFNTKNLKDFVARMKAAPSARPALQPPLSTEILQARSDVLQPTPATSARYVLGGSTP